MRNAARVAYEEHRGDIGGLLVCHKCDTPLCVNPDHLFLGTHADNKADCCAKGRQAFNNGEKNGTARLTEGQVAEIRSLYAHGGIGTEAIGPMYGVSGRQIRNIVRRRQWKSTGSASLVAVTP